MSWASLIRVLLALLALLLFVGIVGGVGAVELVIWLGLSVAWVAWWIRSHRLQTT